MSQQSQRPELEPALFVGIDWSTTTHVVCALAPDGTRRGRLETSHSAEGFARLLDWLLELCPEPWRIAIAIEDPHHPLVDWFLDHGLQVFAINPKQIERFRGRYSVAGAKDDNRDAYVLGDTLRSDRPRFTPLSIPDPAQLAIREASRLYDTLQDDFNRASNRLHGHLLRSAPNLLALCHGANEPFFFELLQLAPTAEAARHLRPPRINALLKKHAKRKFKVEEVLTLLRAPRLSLAPGAHEAIGQTIRATLPILMVAWQQMTAARKRLAELVEAGGRTAEIIDSFPGAAEVVTGTLLAEAPHALADRDLDQLRAVVGSAPVTVRSGKMVAVRMRRACNRRLRDAAFHWAQNAVLRDPVAKAHYQQLRAKGHGHARALRGVIDRLLARLIAALASDTLYQPPPPSSEAVVA